MAKFVERELENGLRVCIEPLDHVPSAAAGFVVRTGARDERPEEEGTSHFLEHMCFKGTANRDCTAVNRRFDELGASHNAYTSHERTLYYGWLPAENVAPQIDLLADMMRSTLPPDEFETEKKVILEEIAMYADDLNGAMFDFLGRQVFKGSSLARSVLGTPETIGPLSRDQMADYQRRRYGPENMVFIATGRVDAEAVIEQVTRLTEGWARGEGGREQQPPTVQSGVAKKQIEKFKRQAILLCYPAPPGQSLDARPVALVRALSGPNSRIFWEVVQKGICSSAGAFYWNFSDVGLLIGYALCAPDRAEQALAGVREQMAKMAAEGPSEFEIERVKNAIRTRVALDGDSPMNRLSELAADIDLVGRPLSLEEDLERIEALTVADVRELLEEYPITGEGMLVSVGPADWP